MKARKCTCSIKEKSSWESGQIIAGIAFLIIVMLGTVVFWASGPYIFALLGSLMIAILLIRVLHYYLKWREKNIIKGVLAGMLFMNQSMLAINFSSHEMR